MSFTLLLRDVCEAVEAVANKYKKAEIPAALLNFLEKARSVEEQVMIMAGMLVGESGRYYLESKGKGLETIVGALQSTTEAVVNHSNVVDDGLEIVRSQNTE